MKDTSEKHYTLHLIEPQLRILSQALECLSRLQSGQIEYAVEAGAQDRYLHKDVNTQTARELCEELKMVLYPELARNESYGVSSRDRPLVGEAYTIKEVLDQALDGRDRGAMKWGTWPRPVVREAVDPDSFFDGSGFKPEGLTDKRGPYPSARFPDPGSDPRPVPDWVKQVTDPDNLRKDSLRKNLSVHDCIRWQSDGVYESRGGSLFLDLPPDQPGWVREWLGIPERGLDFESEGRARAWLDARLEELTKEKD